MPCRRHGGGEQYSAQILDAILVELRNAGILNSRKGKGGGYLLARPAEKITVGQIIRILDGPLAPIACASKTAYQRCADCPDEAACAIRDIMLDARDFIATILDRTSIASLRERGHREQQILREVAREAERRDRSRQRRYRQSPPAKRPNLRRVESQAIAAGYGGRQPHSLRSCTLYKN